MTHTKTRASHTGFWVGIRRIVVYVRDIAASGGYYIACAGDRIVAEPTAILGSISVILQTLNWHELVRELLDQRDVRFVRYEHSVRLGDWLARLQAMDGLDRLVRPRPPRFAYLWQP